MAEKSTYFNQAASYALAFTGLNISQNNYGKLLEVQDEENDALTDVEDLDGNHSDAEESQLPPRVLINDDHGSLANYNNQLKVSTSLLSVPEDAENPTTDHESISDSDDDSDVGDKQGLIKPSNVKTPSSQSRHLQPELNITKKRSTLKKLHQASAYDQSTSETGHLTDLESLSESDSDGKEQGMSMAEVAVSSESEETEGEVLSVSESDSETTYERWLARAARSRRNRDNPGSNFEDGQGSSSAPCNDDNSKNTELPLIMPPNTVIQIIPDVEEGITDDEDMSQASADENVDNNSEISGCHFLGEEVHCSEQKSLNREKSTDTLAENTDEEDGLMEDIPDRPTRKSSLITGFQPEDHITKAEESYNLSNVLKALKKQSSIKITVSQVEIKTEGSSDSTSDTEFAGGQPNHVDKGMVNRNTDSEYHTGSEDEDKISLAEYLTLGDGKSSTQVSTGGGRGNKTRLRRRRQQRNKGSVKTIKDPSTRN